MTEKLIEDTEWYYSEFDNYTKEQFIDTIKKIANKNKLPMLDFQNESSLMRHEYFRDVRHLNDEGAHVWTSFISHYLKDSIVVNELEE